MGRAPLTPLEQARFCAIVRLGCSREAACRDVGASPTWLAAQLRRDPNFARDVHRAEAEAELRHMSRLHQAAQDPDDWRASAWWLQRRWRREAEALAAQIEGLAELLDRLAGILAEELPDAAQQRRVIERLWQAIGDEAADAVSHPPVAELDVVQPRAALPAADADREGGRP